MAGAVLVAIGVGIGALAASGDTGIGPQQTVVAELQSLGASPDLQLLYAPSVSARPGSPGSERQLLSELRVSVLAASTNGAPLSSAGNNAASEVSLTLGGATVADLLILPPRRIFLRADLSAIAGLPLQMSPAARQSIGALGRVLGTGWHRLPRSLLRGLPAAGGTAPTGKVDAKQFVDALSANGVAFTTAPSQNGETVTTVSGTATELLHSLRTVLATSGVSLPNLPGLNPGNGANRSLVVTFYGGAGNVLEKLAVATGGANPAVTFSVAHNPISLSTPVGATPLPPAILRLAALGSQTLT